MQKELEISLGPVGDLEKPCVEIVFEALPDHPFMADVELVIDLGTSRQKHPLARQAFYGKGTGGSAADQPSLCYDLSVFLNGKIDIVKLFIVFKIDQLLTENYHDVIIPEVKSVALLDRAK